MEFTIRPASTEDTRAVSALLERTYPVLLKPDYAKSVLSAALPIMCQARPALMECGTFYVAETMKGQIIGAGGWTPSRDRQGWGDIRHLVTDLDYLRNGVARALMERSFEKSTKCGITRLECWSTLTAQSFYQSCGFEPLGPMDVTLTGGVIFPAIKMVR